MIKGKLIIYRFFELLISELIASFLIVILEFLGIYQHKLVMIVCVFALLAGFVAINFIYSLHLYDFLANVKTYLFFNFTAYFFFGALQVAVYKLTPYMAYIKMFAVTNFLFYSRLSVSAVMCAVVFHGLGFLTIICVPIFFLPAFPPADETNINIDR